MSSGGEPKPTVLETSPFPRAGLVKITVCPMAGSIPEIGDGLGSGSGEGQSNDDRWFTKNDRRRIRSRVDRISFG